MRTSGIFKLLYYPIKFEKFGEPIYIIPFGDVHRHTKLCHLEKWHEFLEWASKKKRAYFLGMGDHEDGVSKSERKALKAANFHDTTMDTLDEVFMRFTDELAEELSFMKGRLIGILEGNHYAELQSGITTTQYLCQKLGCAYLGSSAFIRVGLSQNSKHNTRCAVDIWAHHGKGAARKVGGSLNRVEDWSEGAECDICLMGHDHKKSVGTLSRLYIKSARGGEITLGQRKVLIARTGSFQRGYVDGVKSFVSDEAMNPTDLGTIKIELTPKRSQINDTDTVEVDIHASI